MKVVVINTVTLNTGDSAILQALLRHVAEAWKPQEVIVHDSHPETAQVLYPHLLIRRCLSGGIKPRRVERKGRLGQVLRGLRFRMAIAAVRAGALPVVSCLLDPLEVQALRDYAEADLIITTGGTYLVEHYNVWARIRTFRIAHSLRKPLVFYTQSMGPFTRSDLQAAMSNCLREASLILLRDERSHGYVREIGADGAHVHVLADSVFALPPASTKSTASIGKPRVAISVREWQHFETDSPEAGMERYTQSICAVIQQLVEKYEAEVLFISTCQGVPAYKRDDSEVALKMVEQLSPGVRAHVRVDRSFYTPDAFMEALQECTLMISTRMHGAIMGLISGVPVLPIAYEFKTEEVYKQMGLSEWVERIDEVTPARLEAKVQKFMENPEAALAAMASGVERQRVWADEAVGYMRRVIDHEVT